MRVAVRSCVVLESSTGRSNLPGDLVSLGNAAAGNDHIRAFLGKREGSSFADAGGASGDEDTLVFEGFHIWPQRSQDRSFGKSRSSHETENLGLFKNESISKSGLTAGNRIRLRHIHAKVTIRSSGLPDHGAFIGTDPN